MTHRSPDREPDHDRARRVEPDGEHHKRAVDRLLWTPTEGQDLTKSYFPLSERADDRSD